jgi:DNA-binding transcriptional LysR family regulator
MQIDHLETFLDLCETRSFNRTAERLGLTQSTISARIAALEAALGAKLFTRSRAGTDLTTEGSRFEPHARALRHEWHEARRRIQVPDRAAHLIRLGIQNDLAAQHIGEWIADFRRALPDTAFYIEPDYSNQMCADVLTGILDFAVMYSPKPHPDLHFGVGHEARTAPCACPCRSAAGSPASPRAGQQRPRPAVVAHDQPLVAIAAHVAHGDVGQAVGVIDAGLAGQREEIGRQLRDRQAQERHGAGGRPSSKRSSTR